MRVPSSPLPPWAALSCLAGLALAAGCEGSTGAGVDPRPQVLRTIALEVALPTYREFAEASEQLAARAREFCDAREAARLHEARAAWWSARRPWKRADVFAFHPFGPYSAEPLRLGPKIDFWPAREAALREVLEDAEPIDAERVSRLGAAGIGLPAIEYLLYGSSQSEADLLAAFRAEGAGDRRCDYLLALTQLLEGHAGEMVEAWDPQGGDFAGELIEAGHGSQTFDSLRMAINETFNRMSFALEDIRELKLGRPAGKRSGGTPQPDTVESRFSGRSAQDLVDALAGVRAVYRGELEDQDGGPSFDDQVAGLDRRLNEDLLADLDAAARAVEAIEGPLAEAVVERPDQVEAAYQAVKRAHVTLGVDVANELGVTIMFNNTDAD